MTGLASHAFGCSCRHHVDRPWRRPEHWTRAEVDLLETWFGRWADETLARRLGRSVVGIRLKAKRLGLHKRAAGYTARKVGEIFGVDGSVVGKVWIRRGLLSGRRIGRARRHCNYPSSRGHAVDPYDRPAYWVVALAAIERFIREHPEWVDVDKMPDSPYRDLAAQDPWISLPEVHRRTGRSPYLVALLVRGGRIRGRRRGTHWYVPVADLPLIRSLSPEAIDDSVFRRESVLERRRNRRKGVAA